MAASKAQAILGIYDESQLPASSMLRASRRPVTPATQRGDMQARMLPIAELHLHLEGTLEPETIFAIAERNKVKLPYEDLDELRSRYAFTDLQSFLDLCYANVAVLRAAEDFSDMTTAYLDRARAAGVRHAEVFLNPQAHTARGVPLRDVMEGVSGALSESLRNYGVSSGLIVAFLRDESEESAMETLEAVLAPGAPLIGIGLDSAEVGHPPSKFARVFERAHAEGLHCVAHAGEEGPPSYIWEALDVLGVNRIDHGNRCLEDDQLVRRFVEDQVPLTVCPLSNVSLQVVSEIASHPLATMMERGLKVTVNSDDPAYFGGYVDDNFDALIEAGHLGPADVAKLARNSIEASFADSGRKRQLVEELDAALAGQHGPTKK
jgi:adenosine deaminase